MINEITVRMIQKHIEKGNSIPYICRDVGVSRSVVYGLLNEGFDEHIARVKQKKREPRPRTPCRSYKKSLRPDQWEGAKVFLWIIKDLKALGRTGGQVDLEALRGVWQKRMDEIGRVNVI